MEDNFKDPLFWDKRVAEYGKSAASSAYSDLSQEKRLRKISEIIESNSSSDFSQLKIIDVPCGVGLFDQIYGPFEDYSGIDFSKKACDLAKFSKTKKTNIVHGNLFDRTNMNKIQQGDWLISCGLFCFKHLFSDVDDVTDLIQVFLEKSENIIANFPWKNSRVETKDTVRHWSIDEVASNLLDKRIYPTIYAGYLPHEFMIHIKK